jgi:hypothetical protein
MGQGQKQPSQEKKEHPAAYNLYLMFMHKGEQRIFFQPLPNPAGIIFIYLRK